MLYCVRLNDSDMEIMSKYLVQQKLNTTVLFGLFYSIGVIGLVIPHTQPLFGMLLPFALLLSFVAILLFHKALNSSGTRIVIISIMLISYLVEVIAVNTGLIFGNYEYGPGLGFKVFETPLMIGINWAMLIYCSASLTEKLRLPVGLQIFLASILVLLYYIILEMVAPRLDMWYRSGNTVPFQNYLVWFLLALFFHGLVKWRKVKTANPLAPAIFICQIVFFAVLLVFIN